MTKRLMCLVLAIIMLLSLCMTSCSTEEKKEEEVATEEVQRKNLVLTIYAITDEKTTDEALADVELAVSEYCRAKYKTAIDLRFFTKGEYQAALNEMYDKFAAEEAAALKAEEEAKIAEESRKAAYAAMSDEEKEAYNAAQREAAKKAEEEAKKKAEEEAKLIAEGKDVAEVKEVQMDIIYIPSAADYYSYVDQGLLMDLTQHLEGKFKKICDYVYPSFISAATTNNAIYGIPNNRPIEGNETFLLVNTALAEKYGVNLSKIRSVTDLEDAYAKIAANEEGVAPFLGDWAPEGVEYYPEADMAGTYGIFYDTLLKGRYVANKDSALLNPDSNYGYAYAEYCATRAKYRAAGYLADEAESFFASVKELTAAEKAEWIRKGYTPVLYKGANFTTQKALDGGLFGLSKYCKEAERAMEILQLMSTDADLHNLLTFGIKDVHYEMISDNKDENVIRILDDSYKMDFFGTGNSLISHITEDMDEKWIENGKQKNLNSHMNGFLGFRFDWTKSANAKWLPIFEQWAEFLEPYYAELSAGTEDYSEILAFIYYTVYNNKMPSATAEFTTFKKDEEGKFVSPYAVEYATWAEVYEVLYENGVLSPEYEFKAFDGSYKSFSDGDFRKEYNNMEALMVELDEILHLENIDEAPEEGAAAGGATA